MADRSKRSRRSKVAKASDAIAWLRDTLAIAPKFTIGLLIVIAGSLILWATVHAVIQDVIVLENLSAPKSLEERGYSGAVITQRVFDEAKRISQASGTAKARAKLDGEKNSQLLSTVQLPDTSFSVQTIVTILRDLFGFEETRIGGEVTDSQPTGLQSQPPKLSLLVRVNHKNVRSAKRFESHELDDLIKLAAAEILRRVDPYVLASYYYSEKRWDEMSQIIDQILASEDRGDRQWALNLQGNRLFDIGKYEEAVKYYDRAIELDRKFVMAITNKGRTVRWMGDSAAAMELYRMATLADPKHYAAFNNWGVALFNLDEYDEAIEKFELAIAARRDYALAHRNLGFTWTKKSDHERAAAAYQTAAEIEPKDMHTLFLLASALYRIGSGERAEVYFRRAIGHAPRRDVLKAWGDAFVEVGRFDAARRKYEEIGFGDPDGASVWIKMGNTWLKQREPDFDRAREACHKATVVEPRSPTVASYCANVFQQLGDTLLPPAKDPQAAREEYEIALQYRENAAIYDPANPLHWADLGVTLYKLLDAAGGRKMFEAACRDRPANVEILQKWGDVLRETKKFDEAAMRYGEVIKLRPKHSPAHSGAAEAYGKLGKNAEAEWHARMAREFEAFRLTSARSVSQITTP